LQNEIEDFVLFFAYFSPVRAIVIQWF